MILNIYIVIMIMILLIQKPNMQNATNPRSTTERDRQEKKEIGYLKEIANS